MGNKLFVLLAMIWERQNNHSKYTDYTRTEDSAVQITARSDYEKWGIKFSYFYQACEGEKRAKKPLTKLNYSWRVQCKCTLVSVSRNAGLKPSAKQL